MSTDPHSVGDVLNNRERSTPSEIDEQLYSVAYVELKRLARIHLQRERRDHTLQPTALVSEAYLKLSANRGGHWDSRAHFFGAASRAMGQVLINHATKRRRLKRGGGAIHVPYETGLVADTGHPELELSTLARVVDILRHVHDRAARVFEMRVLGDLTLDEVADALSVSRSTVVNDWRFARYTAKQVIDGDA